VHMSGRGLPHVTLVLSASAGSCGHGEWSDPHRHPYGVTADTEKTLAVDVYAVVHLQRDADAHDLGVDWPEARLRTHAARRADAPLGRLRVLGA